MTDYKTTVFLPQTDFPLRAGLAQKEPEILALWQKMGLGAKLQAANAGKTPFVLHDGPPYANGAMHLGHALNKILKDVVNRTRRMMGHHVHFVPGWDCHGLPIEWKIEQDYRKQGRSRHEISTAEMIGACRSFAAHWIGVQKKDMMRIGVDGDWENTYTTMDKEAESVIVSEIHKFLMADMLYRADRPVMWSVIEQTSLAEAEIEYHDHKSATVWVRFPVKSSPLSALEGANIIIWTTTPWTLPANQAVACGPEMEYAVYTVAETGEKLVLATALAESVKAAAKVEAWTKSESFTGKQLENTVCRHPLHDQGYGEDRPLWMADFVTTDAGTGFVHIAPSHGADDFFLGKQHSVELTHCVGPDGVYYDSVPLFAGKRILTPDGKEGDANGAVIKAIAEAGGLLAKSSIVHSYPHSWRSKAPVIFRCTPQWFVALDKPLAHLGGETLRQRALNEIRNNVRWIPEQGQSRIYAMVEGRQDWCLSRQRVWGVPLALFVNKATGQLLKDERVNNRIRQAVANEGIEAWHTQNPQIFLGTDYRLEEYERISDIADVWFDSACTQAFVLEQRADQHWPADLYLEGSDQHRGWFHSSLLEAVGTHGSAPYREVLTHGFLLDEKGYKQSKSLGNGVDPEQVIKDFGADVLRLAMINCDFRNDITVGPNIIKQQAEQYRRLRNTLRYLLGALAGFSAAERVEVQDMPLLERWVLHRLAEIDESLRADMADYDLNRYFRTLHDFCATDLSAYYFDIRKDSLYCDAPSDVKRRATRTVMEQVFLALTAWLAPVLVFTAEEAWQSWRATGQAGEESVHLRHLPVLPAAWRDEALGQRMEQLRAVRAVATSALEVKRAESVIKSSLEATLSLAVPDMAVVDGVDMAELCITSACTLAKGELAASVSVAPGGKCERCWKILPEVGRSASHPTLCLRCEAVVSGQKKEQAA